MILSSIPAVPRDRVPAITTEEMIEVDRLMIETYGIELIQMMENAGRNLARLAALHVPENQPAGKNMTVLCGSGGNGGGGLVCARHLANWGANVSVVLRKIVRTIFRRTGSSACNFKTNGNSSFLFCRSKSLSDS